MKIHPLKKLLSLALALVMVIGLLPFSATALPEPTPSQSDTTGGSNDTPGDHSGADDKVILHCWNWSYDEIRAYLPQIKAAGFTAVQTSPAQPYLAGSNIGEIDMINWFRLYEPMGLKIAKSDQSWIGGVNELKALCDAAEELGIDVVVDVVSNYIDNAYSDWSLGIDPRHESQIIATGTDSQGRTVYGYQFEIIPISYLGRFNPELYDSSNPTKYFRDYVFVNDESTENVVHGNVGILEYKIKSGMPDFKTEDPVVQTSVLNYLKDLIDVGVDGFRFDSAKHIETPSDGDFASDFWPNVIGGAKAYAESKGREVWSYGDIGLCAGKTRSMNDYVPYIDITEYNYAYAITEALGNHKGAAVIADQQFRDWYRQTAPQDQLNVKSLVLMAESYDMYADAYNSSSRYSAEVINKAWAVAVTRADASSLYLARPRGYSATYYDFNRDLTRGYIVGTFGKCEGLDWTNVEVAQANKFHTAFVGADEAVSASGSYVVIERWNADDCGAVLVNADGTTSSVNADVSHMSDGKYFDQITGAEFTVSGGRVSGSMGDSGIAILRKTAPEACDHPANQCYTRTVEPTCTDNGSNIDYCKLCGRKVCEPEVLPALGHIDENGDNHCDRCREIMYPLPIYFVDTNDWIPKDDDINCIRYYAWNENGGNNGWPGTEMKVVGRTKDDHGIWKAEINPEKYSMLLFNAGYDGVNQSVDISYLTDAANYPVLVYTADKWPDAPVERILVTPGAVLREICGHTKYREIDNGTLVLRICECCGNVDDSQYKGSFLFDDVKKPSDYYFIPVYWAYTHNPQITDGVSDTLFGTNQECTRAQVVTFLWRAYGCQAPKSSNNPFKDVKEGDYYYDAVLWAVENGITDGMTRTTFVPNGTCTRAQVVTFLWRAAGKPVPPTSKNTFSDVSSGSWFKQAVQWAVVSGVTDGTTDTTFSPNVKCIRAQVVTFLFRALKDQ